jgi:hypothetical protein
MYIDTIKFIGAYLAVVDFIHLVSSGYLAEMCRTHANNDFVDVISISLFFNSTSIISVSMSVHYRLEDLTACSIYRLPNLKIFNQVCIAADVFAI